MTPPAETIDWTALRSAARDAASRAYAPYSRLHVGAAGLDEAGSIIIGCNVENASYGLTLCAECVLVGNLHLAGSGRLVAVACATEEGELLMPCGRCRQLLFEAGGGELLVDGLPAPSPLADLLPAAFTAADLPERP